MGKSKPDYSIFSGLVFWGSEYFPKNLRLSLGDIRKWSYITKMIWDPEAQFVIGERLDQLNNYFKPEDKLSILINVSQNDKGEMNYIEYPYIPVKTLIKYQMQIEIVYWQFLPKTSISGIHREYDELRFGFWYPGVTGDEFASISYAKVIYKKFFDLFNDIQNEYDTKVLLNGFTDITVDGEIKAKFFKTGRFHDVELTW
jgi:hypothetical protein